MKEIRALVFISSYVFSFFFLGSILLFIFLNVSSLLSVIVKLVGYDLVNNYFPLSEKGFRAENPVIVFGLSVFVILLFDYVSLKIFDSIDAEKVSELQQKMRDLYEQGKPLEGNEQTNMAL